jgi:hypothetical protein
MNKILLVAISLILIIACSDKQEEIETPIKKNIEIKKVPDLNKTKEVNATIKREVEGVNMMVIPTEFIPEHVRNSTIETVKHY